MVAINGNSVDVRKKIDVVRRGYVYQRDELDMSHTGRNVRCTRRCVQRQPEFPAPTEHLLGALEQRVS